MLFLIFGSMDFGVENIVQLSALLIAWLSVFCFCYFFLYEEYAMKNCTIIYCK